MTDTPSASSPGPTTSTHTETADFLAAVDSCLSVPKLTAMHPKQAARELMVLGVHPAVVERYLAIRLRAFSKPDVRAYRKLAKSYAKATKYRKK